MQEGDRVRDDQRKGTTGVVKGFGSLPGVPTVVHIAYGGHGGLQRLPEEVKIIDGFAPQS